MTLGFEQSTFFNAQEEWIPGYSLAEFYFPAESPMVSLCVNNLWEIHLRSRPRRRFWFELHITKERRKAGDIERFLSRLSAAGNNNELVTGHQRHRADKNILLTNLLTDAATVRLSAICHSPR